MKTIILFLNLLLSIPAFAGQQSGNAYQLIMPQPAALNVPGSDNEVQGFDQYQGDLYIGYYTNGTSSSIYKWDGNVETSVYTLGLGPGNGQGDFESAGALQDYQGNLYAGNQGSISGNGGVFVYNPNAAASNFIQFPSSTNVSNAALTVPNDNANNAIFGSTAFSIEYYGRIDDLGGNNAGHILRKTNSAVTSGYGIHLNKGNSISAFIVEGGTPKSTVTNTNAFTLGNYHDIIMSWAAGSHPVIYVDGIVASLASSVTATTPSNDTASPLYIGNELSKAGVFGGTFRRLRIWRNYVVSATDAKALASGGTIMNLPTGQYLFTEGSGTTTADSSGHGNTATITQPAYWNNTSFDLSFNNGNDVFMYALTVFNGKLYAGAGYLASRIYSYNGTSWSTAYPGLPGYGLVVSLYSYNGLLFAALGGSKGGAILSTPDGVNWTTETTVPASLTSEFNRFVQFQGNLYAGIIKSGAGNSLYERSPAGTWAPVNPSVSCGQVWGLSVYNNAMYIGCTTTGGATIYKTIDGVNFTQDFQVPNANETEAFNMIVYNGSLYIGTGFSNTRSADIYSKTDAPVVPSLPAVTITSPQDGSNYATGSNITFTAMASETGGTIAGIFLYNGAGVLLASNTSSSSLSFVYSNVLPGTYTFTAVARDTNGVSVTSNPITVSVMGLPVVAISYPANGANLTAGTNVTLTASASEINGSIAQVSYYDDGIYYLGSSTTAPYNLTVFNVPAGNYTVTAVATDAQGNSVTSSVIAVSIN